MTTERRFAAFSKGALPPRMNTVPQGGMCISAFLVISKKGELGNVLMGRINKNAEWDHIGALNGKRLERFASGWMLPSSHLILFETPEGAARRILREQLGIRNQPLEGPLTFADTSGTANHWGPRLHIHRREGDGALQPSVGRAKVRRRREAQARGDGEVAGSTS